MNKKIFKRLLILVVCMIMFCGTTLSVSAASYTQKRARCPRCNQINTSYGYSANHRWSSVSVNGGHYCEPCGRVLGDSEYHMYLYSSDIYYFMCSSSRCSKLSVSDRTYTVLYDNPVSEHYTNGVRDY